MDVGPIQNSATYKVDSSQGSSEQNRQRKSKENPQEDGGSNNKNTEALRSSEQRCKQAADEGVINSQIVDTLKVIQLLSQKPKVTSYPKRLLITTAEQTSKSRPSTDPKLIKSL